MKLSRNRIDKLAAQIDAICKYAAKLEKKYAKPLARLHPLHRRSAANFLHYLALRRRDIRPLQERLGFLGVSRLGRTEGHVMASLLAVKDILHRIANGKGADGGNPDVSFKLGRKFLRRNTVALLGKKLKGSKARIMVTLPTEAAYDCKMVSALISAGMSCARINCAHDDSEVWQLMIENIKRVRHRTGRTCKVCMDLAGPKLRTGLMAAGPQVIHLRPERDLFGRVTKPCRIWLAPKGLESSPEASLSLPIVLNESNDLRREEAIWLRDARGKRCELQIEDLQDSGFWVSCVDSAYLVPEIEFMRKGSETIVATVGELPASEQGILLKLGDALILHADSVPGEPASLDAQGNVMKPAHISCTLPEVFESVHAGEPILFDDGKIEGVIRSVSPEEIEIEITYAREEGTWLRSDKGINLPESNLKISGLTPKDREDLKFIVKHADIVSLSFVNSPRNVLSLLKALKRLKASDLGVVIKIETQHGYRNLPAILLAGMRTHPIGVMIARGDLAIEAGWKNLAGIQQEILWLSEAAHVPIIWATQVLETLAKKGRPSRAEISDAAMAQQAECVMLNKGPHIVETVEMLGEILTSMEDYHQKKAPMMPKLKVLLRVTS